MGQRTCVPCHVIVCGGPPFIKYLVSLVRISFRDWGDGTEVQVLTTQVWRLEHVSPAPMKLPHGCGGSLVTPAFRRRKRITEASWLARVAKLSTSGFSERFLSQSIKWGAIKKDILGEPLSSSGMYTHVCLHTHMHPLNHIRENESYLLKMTVDMECVYDHIFLAYQQKKTHCRHNPPWYIKAVVIVSFCTNLLMFMLENIANKKLKWAEKHRYYFNGI